MPFLSKKDLILQSVLTKRGKMNICVCNKLKDGLNENESQRDW